MEKREEKLLRLPKRVRAALDYMIAQDLLSADMLHSIPKIVKFQNCANNFPCVEQKFSRSELGTIPKVQTGATNLPAPPQPRPHGSLVAVLEFAEEGRRRTRNSHRALNSG